MLLLEAFNHFIATEHLFLPKDKLLLAVSGGMDSVVLCELCNQAGYDFTIAHCNFQLRGAESERDEQFVRQLGIQYGKEVLVKRFDTELYAVANKVSIQVAARELRYSWFNELIVSGQSAGVSRETSDVSSGSLTYDSRFTIHDRIVTAHHLDDNIETMLMNFFKGTGITGLRGILPKQGKLVRPLLFAHKEALKTFAEANNMSWVEDSSNTSDKYTRNYFRRHVIPLIEKMYPAVEGNLSDNLGRFREAEQLYRQAIDLHKKKLLEHKGNEVRIPVLKLKKAVPLTSIVYEIIRDYGFSPQQASEVIALLDSESGKYVSSATHRVIRNRNWLIIAALNDTSAETILIEGIGDWGFGTGELELRRTPNPQSPIPNSPNIATLDGKKINFPLLLRKWKTGDYFYPLGMQKKKKLARFFIDQKLSRTAKENIWVIEMNKKIVWIVGHRIDDRFKITSSTTELLTITLKSIA